jgi:hypothetical protein
MPKLPGAFQPVEIEFLARSAGSCCVGSDFSLHEKDAEVFAFMEERGINQVNFSNGKTLYVNPR